MTIKEYSGGSAAAAAAVLDREEATKRHGGKVKGARYIRRYKSPWILVFLKTNDDYPADMFRDRFRVPPTLFKNIHADLLVSLLIYRRHFSMGSEMLAHVSK